MRNNQSLNNLNDKLNLDEKTKNENHPLLSTLNVPFTSRVIFTFLYEIVKLSKGFMIPI